MKFNEMTIEHLKAYGTTNVIDGTLDEASTYSAHQKHLNTNRRI